MNLRKVKGFTIAKKLDIVQKGNCYLVQSQTDFSFSWERK